jgi:hypothetical protein
MNRLDRIHRISRKGGIGVSAWHPEVCPKDLSWGRDALLGLSMTGIWWLG